MLNRFKLYFTGVGLGCLFVYFILSQKGASCAYLPNARVLDEISNKPKEYSKEAEQNLISLKLDTTFITQKVFKDSDIDFKNSDPRAVPCGKYKAYHPKREKNFLIEFEKCDSSVVINAIKKLN